MKAAHTLPPEDVMAYLDGELNGDEARDIQAHLAGCPECQRLSAELREGSMQLREWSVEDVRLTFVAPAPRQHPPRRDWFGLRVWTYLTRRPLIAGAFAVVAVAIVGAITIQPARKSSVVTVESSSVERLGGSRVPRGFALSQQAQQGQQGQNGIDRQSVAEPAQIGPRIVRTARLRIVATDFNAVRPAIDRILQSSAGFVGSITASDRPGATRSIHGDLRIPSRRFDAALAALRGLGRVTEDSQNAEDVTSTVVDLDVRISNARATEKRLSDVLQNRTGRLSDVLEVEREIMRVRTEIEQMESQRKQLDGRIEYATITLEVDEEQRASVNLGPIPIPTRLRQAVADGVESAAMSVLAVTISILRGGPVLLLWLAVLGLPVWWLLRRYAVGESREPRV
ncbi:MAG TPA: DUF4349 domain-containing protein [Vicinamibacterales bacterium]|nr:DUF4349 domain-containing protein [Vicinamibacterales bacterium]